MLGRESEYGWDSAIRQIMIKHDHATMSLGALLANRVRHLFGERNKEYAVECIQCLANSRIVPMDEIDWAYCCVVFRCDSLQHREIDLN